MSNILDEILEASNNVDQSTIENDGPKFPIVQWNFGKLTNKKLGGMDYHGGWFVGAEMIDLSTAEGWTATSWTHNDGSESEGFYRREIEVSLVRTRKRWEVYKDGKRSSFAWKDYESAKNAGRASGRTHFLVIIKGLEDYGPFVLTLKGVSAMAFEGTRQQKGAMQQFSATVIKSANETLKKAKSTNKLPFRAFWLKVGGDRKPDGSPIFTEVGQGADKTNLCFPVAIGLPEKPEGVDLRAYFVGGEMLQKVNAIYEETADWAEAWNTITANPDEPEKASSGKRAAPEVSELDMMAEQLGV